MKNFIKKYYDYIILISILAILVIVNVHPNRLIIGLDNASPYFGVENILSKIHGTSSIIYGGIVFQTPFLYLSQILKLTPELISNIYIFSNLVVGVIGYYLLVRRENKNKIYSLTTILVLISSLFTFWIFSQPNFLFLASYSSIPWLIYLLSSKTNKWNILLLIFFTTIFLTTSLNIVAFGLYTIQIAILAKAIQPKTTIKKLVLWVTSMIIFWLLTLQIRSIVNGDNTFIIINILEYIKDLTNNPYMPIITEGILASEKTNGVINTLSYSLGWMELHTPESIPVFGYYHLYKESIPFVLIGILPGLIALSTIFIRKNKKTILLTLLLITFIIISSKYGMTLIEHIPYINNALRWASSKLWPIYTTPLLILVAKNFRYFSKIINSKIPVMVSLLLCTALIIYSLPMFTGNLLSSTTLTNIPKEYLELPRESKILILPEPELLYMREYNWGYYGSDFISYTTNSQIIDAANLYESAPIYKDILSTNNIPEDITYILYDKSTMLNTQYPELLSGYKLIDSNKYFDLYERE